VFHGAATDDAESRWKSEQISLNRASRMPVKREIRVKAVVPPRLLLIDYGSRASAELAASSSLAADQGESLLPRWVTASGVAANPGRSTADERVAAMSV
jgi:hypothetical protein